MRLYLVDSFTDTAFRGNPAGVVLLDSPADEGWMQAVAAELKHSETAFVVTSEEPKPLRWFTPVVEVDLCGHATLAAAHVLGGDQVFTTRSGELRCQADGGRVSMEFPADIAVPAELPSAALPVATEYVAQGVSDVLAVLADAGQVRSLEPDLDAIAGWDGRCLIVTAPSDRPGIDFVSRVFGPAVGIPEDPVTGSAHCTLAPYWAERLGRTELVGEQASARGGIVHMRLRDDRVVLSGTAVTVLAGELLV
ncbi:PhzF family phenazine biosynthesis protein [Saccharomonospora sp. NPDC046836]|uniref:PhzF family phenazine biosynthesis protein n=1 Tax=Saccharomonospora sp. NPDC046836 TaxID=3156921 RepID=UPI0033F6326F